MIIEVVFSERLSPMRKWPYGGGDVLGACRGAHQWHGNSTYTKWKESVPSWRVSIWPSLVASFSVKGGCVSRSVLQVTCEYLRKMGKFQEIIQDHSSEMWFFKKNWIFWELLDSFGLVE